MEVYFNYGDNEKLYADLKNIPNKGDYINIKDKKKYIVNDVVYNLSFGTDHHCYNQYVDIFLKESNIK